MLHKSPSKTYSTHMTLDRMGSRYPSRLSFSRSILRTMVKENWTINRVKFNLDKKGYGIAIYEVATPNQVYSLVCFSQYIADEDRSDRVIAEKWDTTYSLHIGTISAKDLVRLKKNVPLQEAGRNSPNELVISRANKSVRLFKKVVQCLSEGIQPDIKDINAVGYLLRTTAVYGSGKFGLSDYARTKFVTHFDQPFRAEMLAVYIIREFSVDLIEHIAYHNNPLKAVKLENHIKQHLGIGNSTGLGMAPFIIKHPKLIHKWMNQFQKTLEKINEIKNIDPLQFNEFINLLHKAQTYLNEVLTSDKYQKNKNYSTLVDLKKMIKFCNNLSQSKNQIQSWYEIIDYAEKNFNFDTQEIVRVQIVELFPSIADPLAEDMSDSEEMYIDTSQTVLSIIDLIRNKYAWAINTDFNNENNLFLFWYISEEKLEPRLGERYNEKGAELEEPLGIGKMVYDLYNFIINRSEMHKFTIAEFLLRFPQYRGVIRRIQTLSNCVYGELNDNILARNTLSINMLRFKLSFFGASRYDPKSDRWLRVSFFAGAPFYNKLSSKNVENWGFATMNSYQ